MHISATYINIFGTETLQHDMMSNANNRGATVTFLLKARQI